MARYSAQKRKEELTELETSILQAMLIISMTDKKAYAATMGQGGIAWGVKLWVPGRSICKFIGGKWTHYRHQAAMKLVENKCLEAWKGYEKNSDKKELWRYSLTEQAVVYYADLIQRATKDCIRFTPAWPQLFEIEKHEI